MTCWKATTTMEQRTRSEVMGLQVFELMVAQDYCEIRIGPTDAVWIATPYFALRMNWPKCYAVWPDHHAPQHQIAVEAFNAPDLDSLFALLGISANAMLHSSVPRMGTGHIVLNERDVAVRMILTDLKGSSSK